jgi:hypothetical protein
MAKARHVVSRRLPCHTLNESNREPLVMESSRVFLALGWCMLGYWFLGCGEIAYSMLSSMAALTTVVYGLDIRGYQRSGPVPR